MRPAESAAGVRFMPQAMATRDIDLPFDTRKHLAFFSRMKASEESFLGLPKKADKSFVRLDDQIRPGTASPARPVSNKWSLRRMARWMPCAPCTPWAS
ncbi:MAG: GSU2403 family nucleotidyltransferase fold protein [Janthinobacterium lividum]